MARLATTLSRLGRLPVAVAIAGVALAVAAGGTAQVSVKNQEHRLLTQKAIDADAFLATLFMNAEDSLRVVAGDGVPTPDELSDYIVRPGPLGGPAVAVVSARPARSGMVVAAAIGKAPSVGETIRGEQGAVLARAAATGHVATALLNDAGRTTLLLAFPTHDANGVLATSQESFLSPTTPVPLTAGSPFADLRGAFYAGAPVPANLLLTTESQVPIRGTVVRTSVPIGGQEYTTVIGARNGLVGPLDKAIPSILFRGGLVAAALAAAIAQVLSRRRESALALVEQRTHELAQAHDFLEGIFTAGPLVVVRRSLTANTVTYVSPNSERVFGYAATVARENGFLTSVTHPDDMPVLAEAFNAVASRAVLQTSIETRVRTAGGRYRWVSTILVCDDEHHVGADEPQCYVVEYILDVDDRHRAEMAQGEAQREAEEAQARAETESRHKSEFLSHMSHELRTPLNAVLGFAQLLEIEVTDTSQQEEIRQILEGGNHLLALINELLDIARIESGRLTIALEDVDPASLINEAVELIRPLATQRNITILRDLDACNGWLLRVDAQRAKQVLLNLLSNATKYNNPAGTIAVKARLVEPGRIAIDVSDTGPGIAPDKLERLFEPFERVGAEYTGIDGAGIGLALARELSAAMGATLDVSSTPGAGSTFTVEFDASPRSGATDAAAPSKARDSSDFARLDIVYIEDDVANLNLVERLIAKDGKFRLIGALTASLGLQLVREHAPKLILLDLNLPDIPGQEVLRRLRADPATASIPVVVVSADAMESQVQHLLSEGAVAYLTKPLVLAEVLRVIRDNVPALALS